MIYFDTSALIKRYIWEPGSREVHHLFKSDSDIVTATIAHAEVYAALTRRMREGHFAETRYTQACRLFEREWSAYLIVELDDEILRFARELIKKYPLRSLDAIHLASAKFLSHHIRKTFAFACSDRNLSDFAKREGFKLVELF